EEKTVVILGRSGVGKSVLLRHILGLEQVDQGTIDVDGIRITDLPRQELYQYLGRFGMVFQGSALFDSMTVAENVAFYLSQHGNTTTGEKFSEQELMDKAEEALIKVGLADFGKKMPSELSGGQKRRAALARLIIYRPKIMLYDEPTTGLDPITSGQINDLILATQQELKATAILVTHDLQSAMHVGDYFALHQDGKIHHFDEKERFIQSDEPVIQEFFKTIAKAKLEKKYA
ncbi:MAG TPA: ATP-binding cassette domain-containing protein, partial [Chlamydiales bacterium]|nr:ATP-binding cassette domain-containing protein [Chlamydiales bacterium]